jgi:hypothetical protein
MINPLSFRMEWQPVSNNIENFRYIFGSIFVIQATIFTSRKLRNNLSDP